MLLLEFGVLGGHVGPRDLQVGELANELSDLVNWHAHLLHRVALSQRHGGRLLERVKVDGDGIGDGDLVRSRVVSAD